MTIDFATTLVRGPGSWPAPTPEKAAENAQAAPSAQAPAKSTAAQPQPTADALREAVKQIESLLQGSARSLQFTVDEATGRTVISVRDAESGDLIRQIPSEDVLRVARALSNGSKSLMETVV